MKYAIVCVDDDQGIVDVLSYQLKKYFSPSTTLIETLTNPMEVENCIEELLGYGVDILFLIVDYQMPEMNGATLIKKVKQKHPNLVCFMLSGQSNNIVVSELIETGLLSEFIEKPWVEKRLVEKIEPFILKIKKEEND